MYPWLLDTYKQVCSRVSVGKLHHGLLLQGPNGLGKAHFALELAQFLLCTAKHGHQKCGQCQSCLLNLAVTHPDLHIVESEKQIGVEQIREAIKKLSGSAQMSGAKVLIIYSADSMTESSANALLKTLEEPTSDTYLLLTTDKPERILPTIKSRCEKFTLPLPELDTTLAWVKSQYAGEVDIHFAKLFASRPLALMSELQEQQSFSYQSFSSGLERLLLGQVSAMQLAMEWQDNADKVLKWSQYWLHQLCTKQVSENLWQANQHAINVAKQLHHPGINKILVLSGLLDKLAAAKPQS